VIPIADARERVHYKRNNGTGIGYANGDRFIVEPAGKTLRDWDLTIQRRTFGRESRFTCDIIKNRAILSSSVSNFAACGVADTFALLRRKRRIMRGIRVAPIAHWMPATPLSFRREFRCGHHFTPGNIFTLTVSGVCNTSCRFVVH
jgi:hypothetical protein